MKKILAVAATIALLGGLITFAEARPRGGWGGYGNCDGPGTCWEDGKANRGDCNGPGSCWEEGSVNRGRGGRGFGPGNCRQRNFDAAAIEGEIDSGEKAAEIVTSYIDRTGNPNLKVGKVTEAGRDYEVEIVTQDGSLANKVYVEKRSGRVISAYR